VKIAVSVAVGAGVSVAVPSGVLVAVVVKMGVKAIMLQGGGASIRIRRMHRQSQLRARPLDAHPRSIARIAPRPVA
jgi:hypothetical protein